jgi:riboflavin biosynthesis pyrimidine reductase
MEEINVRLFPFQQFYKTASQPKNRTDALMQICDALQEGKRTVETWCGFVQAFTDGGGRPYVKEQVAILQDHEFDTAATATQARVYLLLDSHLRTPPKARMLQTPGAVLIATVAATDGLRRSLVDARVDAGVEVIHSLSELVGLVSRDRPS